MFYPRQRKPHESIINVRSHYSAYFVSDINNYNHYIQFGSPINL